MSLKIDCNLVILAAGQGTRMKWKRPKILCEAAGEAVVNYVVRACLDFASEVGLEPYTNLVLGHEGQMIESHCQEFFPNKLHFSEQKEQLGTAHALTSFFDSMPKAWTHAYTFIICGDSPLVRAKDLALMWDRMQSEKSLKAIAATFETPMNKGLGRILRKEKGFLIVEEKDASEEIKQVKEVNSGLYLVETDYLKKKLSTIGSDNASKEFYLTDLFQEDEPVEALKFPEAWRFLGVNTLEDLALAEKNLYREKAFELMREGVRILDPESTYIQSKVQIEAGSIIYPNVFIEGESFIGKDVIIETGALIRNSHIADSCEIKAYSYIEDSKIGSACAIGPFARLRTGTILEGKVKIGNFVETKKTHMKEGSKASHLTYLGDSEVGVESNIGCGFITCNYDGKNKHKTIIGDGTFIGSDCQAIAPVTIGSDAFIAAGSTITQNVPDNGFAVARQKQVTKPDMARKFLKK